MRCYFRSADDLKMVQALGSERAAIIKERKVFLVKPQKNLEETFDVICSGSRAFAPEPYSVARFVSMEYGRDVVNIFEAGDYEAYSGHSKLVVRLSNKEDQLRFFNDWETGKLAAANVVDERTHVTMDTANVVCQVRGCSGIHATADHKKFVLTRYRDLPEGATKRRRVPNAAEAQRSFRGWEANPVSPSRNNSQYETIVSMRREQQEQMQQMQRQIQELSTRQEEARSVDSIAVRGANAALPGRGGRGGARAPQGTATVAGASSQQSLEDVMARLDRIEERFQSRRAEDGQSEAVARRLAKMEENISSLSEKMAAFIQGQTEAVAAGPQRRAGAEEGTGVTLDDVMAKLVSMNNDQATDKAAAAHRHEQMLGMVERLDAEQAMMAEILHGNLQSEPAAMSKSPARHSSPNVARARQISVQKQALADIFGRRPEAVKSGRMTPLKRIRAGRSAGGEVSGNREDGMETDDQ